MRRYLSVSLIVLVAGCGPREQAAEEQPAMPAGIALADAAGTWAMQAMNATGDSTLVTAQLVATDGMDGWTFTFPDRDPVPMRILAVDGDSIVTEMGPYLSVLREDMNVTVRSVMRLENGMLMGTFDAHYVTTDPDSVLMGQLHGTRTP